MGLQAGSRPCPSGQAAVTRRRGHTIVATTRALLTRCVTPVDRPWCAGRTPSARARHVTAPTVEQHRRPVLAARDDERARFGEHVRLAEAGLLPDQLELVVVPDDDWRR